LCTTVFKKVHLVAYGRIYTAYTLFVRRETLRLIGQSAISRQPYIHR